MKSYLLLSFIFINLINNSLYSMLDNENQKIEEIFTYDQLLNELTSKTSGNYPTFNNQKDLAIFLLKIKLAIHLWKVRKTQRRKYIAILHHFDFDSVDTIINYFENKNINRDDIIALSLDHNKIKYFDCNLFFNLYFLSIKNNKILGLPRNINNAEYLHAVILDNNDFSRDEEYTCTTCTSYRIKDICNLKFQEKRSPWYVSFSNFSYGQDVLNFIQEHENFIQNCQNYMDNPSSVCSSYNSNMSFSDYYCSSFSKDDKISYISFKKPNSCSTDIDKKMFNDLIEHFNALCFYYYKMEKENKDIIEIWKESDETYPLNQLLTWHKQDETAWKGFFKNDKN